jgi:hypothetical protein
MKYSIGLTVNSELKRLLDAIPSGQRSEVIREAIRAYAPQIKSMKIELEKLEEEHRAWSERIQEERIIRQKKLRVRFEILAKHEVKIWLRALDNSEIDLVI